MDLIEQLDLEAFWFEDEPEPETWDGPMVGMFIIDPQYSGIAFRIVGDNGESVKAIMVGDDREHLFDRDDVEQIDREAFCGECGAMGCTHDGLERD